MTNENSNLFCLSLSALLTNSCFQNEHQTAVIDHKRHVSYGVLHREAALIAQYLWHNGVRQGQTVIVISDRSIESVEILYAILLCGAIYVPVDATYPPHRINQIGNDLGSPVIIDVAGGFLNANKISYSKYIPLRDILTKKTSIEYEIPSPNLDNIAYIIYTSGTTGKPKGVSISCKSVLNTLLWMQKQFCIGPGVRIAHKTSISFTDSIWEILWPLLSGATISIADNIEARDPRALFDWLDKQKIEITQFVPSMLKLFLEYVESRDPVSPLPHLKWVFNGGEHIPIHLVKKYFQLFKTAKFANLYGMTESSIYATSFIVPRGFETHFDDVPIGKPISNTSVYLVNRQGRLCKTGETGEIYIEGIGLSNGYWGDSKLTDEKYIRHHNRRFFKSGDLGRQDNQNLLWYCGRTDRQVKIRGNRVELYEIEKNILSIPGIEQAAVYTQQNKFGDTLLVCNYWGKAIAQREMRAMLQKKLPNYMIPNKFIYTKETFMTNNQKLDYQKLQSKEKIIDLWKDILGTDQVCEEDDFFESGGDSIGLARLQINLEKLGYSCHYEDLLNNRTLKSILKIIIG